MMVFSGNVRARDRAPGARTIFLVLLLLLSGVPATAETGESVRGFIPAVPARAEAPNIHTGPYPIPAPSARALRVVGYDDAKGLYEVRHRRFPSLVLYVQPATGGPQPLAWIEVPSSAGRLGILVYGVLSQGTSALVHTQEATVVRLRDGRILTIGAPVAEHTPPKYGRPMTNAASWNLYHDRIEIIIKGRKTQTVALK